MRDGLAVLKWIYRKRVEEKCAVVAIGKDEKIFEPEFHFLPEAQ